MTDWILGANYPLEEAYGPIIRGQKYFLAAVLISSLLVIMAVRVIMVRYTDTLVRFASHVHRISSKHGAERLFKHDSQDEIGILVQTFNAMIRYEDRKSEELYHNSTHDALTGLYNRAYFDAELTRLSRGRLMPISVVVADVDLLKECNDTVGHAAGDVLIKAAASTLLESFRAEDVVARTGGDEFGVLLPGVDAEQAEQTLQRLRKALEKSTPPVMDFPLSVSFGCATAGSPDELMDAFEQADHRMYHEKRRKQAIAALS
jgi:diguanylate cyclase (GGDEF)-like protein